VAAGKRSRDAKVSRSATHTRSGPSRFKKRSCSLCKHHVRDVDYKDLVLLRRFLSEKGKIRSRDRSGACRRHQRLLAVAIKRAREMALLPYVAPNDVAPERQRSRR